MKSAAFLFLIAFFGTLISASAQDVTPSDSVYTSVDVQPTFPGGHKALGKIVDSNKSHKYPEEARKNKIEGKVIIGFIINEDGSCSDFTVLKGIGYGCDEAALEAFKKMPKWNPGMVNGKPVKVRVQMGYDYRL